MTGVADAARACALHPALSGVRRSGRVCIASPCATLDWRNSGTELMTLPETRYAKSGEVRIAYQVVGQGSLDLVFVPGWLSNLEVHWEEAGFSHLLHRLATFTRLILLDKRGTGLSDRVGGRDPPSLDPTSLQTHVEDVRAVMDAAGSGRAALL